MQEKKCGSSAIFAFEFRDPVEIPIGISTREKLLQVSWVALLSTVIERVHRPFRHSIDIVAEPDQQLILRLVASDSVFVDSAV